MNVYNPLLVATEKIARERSSWIDATILDAIPKWKADLIIKYKSRLLARILGVNFEIEHNPLLDEFGEKIVIKLNGEVIGYRKFKY